MKKLNLNEDLFQNDSIEDEQMSIELVSMLLGLIRSKFDSIEQLNGFKQYVTQANFDSNVLNIVENIIDDENKHVGMLQSAFKAVSPEASNIIAGENEAEQQLD